MRWGTAEECTTASEGKPAGSETGVRGSCADELAGATEPGRSAAAVHGQEDDNKASYSECTNRRRVRLESWSRKPKALVVKLLRRMFTVGCSGSGKPGHGSATNKALASYTVHTRSFRFDSRLAAEKMRE